MQLDTVYEATFTGCVFDNNTASEQIYHWAYGGAMAIMDSDDVIINDCTFTNNYADCYGGAIYSNDSQITINDSTFLNNNCVLEGVDFDAEAATNFGLGGAIYATGYNGYDYLNLDNCIIEGNQAYNGGGIFCDNMVLDIKDSRFINNSAIVSKDYSEFPIEFLVELFVYIIFFL